MRNIIEKLKEENTVVVFDFDGVLGSYEYTDRNHAVNIPDEEWENYVEDFHPFENKEQLRPFKTIQKFINGKDLTRIYMCSVASGEIEENAKRKFAMEKYHIPTKNIFFVKSKKNKIDILRQLHETKYPDLKENQIAMVEDTVATLNQIMKESEFMTVHVTSFMD